MGLIIKGPPSQGGFPSIFPTDNGDWMPPDLPQLAACTWESQVEKRKRWLLGLPPFSGGTWPTPFSGDHGSVVPN